MPRLIGSAPSYDPDGEDGRIGEIVDVDELAARRAGSPDLDERRGGARRFVEATQQRTDDVRVVRGEVVARAVGVGGDPRDKWQPVLAAEGIT